MKHFIDRRLNPKDKSLGNRQRFLKRARAEIKELVNQRARDRRIADADLGETISIPQAGIDEPRFERSPEGGRRQTVLPGNRDFVVGDRIEKDKSADGEGGACPRTFPRFVRWPSKAVRTALEGHPTQLHLDRY